MWQQKAKNLPRHCNVERAVSGVFSGIFSCILAAVKDHIVRHLCHILTLLSHSDNSICHLLGAPGFRIVVILPSIPIMSFAWRSFSL